MPRSQRRIGALPALLAPLALTLAPAGSGALGLERGPYLQRGTDDAMVIRWRTDAATDSRLRYGPIATQLDSVVDVPGGRTEHEIELQGLPADALFYYEVGDSSQVLAGGDTDHFFRTAPLPGTPRPFQIWILGDSGSANAHVIRVRDAFLTFNAGASPDLWLMLGDNAYSDGTDAEHTAAVFQIFPAVLRNAVLWTTPGNHEFDVSDSATQSGPYYDAFTLPTLAEAGGVSSGTEAYYSFDYANVHFVTLDSTDTPRGVGDAMHSWLEADLMANTQDWVIAFWHHPPYSKGSHDSDVDGGMKQMRGNFMPVLEDYGVDLTLTGHSHSYERSMLIDAHYGLSSTFNSVHVVDGGDGDPNGTGSYQKGAGPQPHLGAVHAVVGSSSKLTDSGTHDHPVMVRDLIEWGSAVIEVSGNTLNARFLNDLGLVLDEFEIVKGRVCDDGLDNDGDGLVDLLDPGCADALDSSEQVENVACDDGLDNDGDQLVDLADPECLDPADTSEAHSPIVGLSIQIASAGNDVEEHVSTDNSVDLGGAALELVEDGTTTQAIGLRFVGVDVPPGSTILSASVQFTAGGASSDPTSLTIYGEASDHALPFTGATADVTSRPTTAAAVAWHPPSWSAVGLMGPAEQSPDLTPVVQEIVSRPGWAEGNAVVLVATGIGRRSADAYDADPLSAPRLELSYVPEPGAAGGLGAGIAGLLTLARRRPGGRSGRDARG